MPFFCGLTFDGFEITDAEGQYSADETRPRVEIMCHEIMGHENMCHENIVHRIVKRDRANCHAVMPFDRV